MHGVSRGGAASEGERHERELALPLFLLGVVCAGVAFATAALRHDAGLRYFAGACLAFACLIPTYCILSGIKIANTLYIIALTAALLFVMFLDLAGRTTTGDRDSWPMFIIVLDVVLVLRIGRTFALVALVACSFWICLVEAEGAYRFGLFDIPLTATVVSRIRDMKQYSTCEVPPCKQDAVVSVLQAFTSVTIFVVDFITTRWFADQAEKEKATMRHTIDTVQRVALHLAEYDLDVVASILDTDDATLPPRMHKALCNLEENMRAYRPYLPKSCLPLRDDPDTPLERTAVYTLGSSEGEVAVVDSNSNEMGLTLQRWSCLMVKRVTCLVGNLHGSLARLDLCPRDFSTAFTAFLHETCVAVDAARGVVDSFLGDRVFSSFNTSRNCVLHASNAITAAKNIKREIASFNFSICTGRAWCGDVGCADMRRFSVLGRLTVECNGLERAGRILGLALVCNDAAHSDAACHHELRLIPRIIRIMKPALLKTGEPDWCCTERDGVLAFEVMTPTTGLCPISLASHEATEWMYEVSNPKTQAIDRYNVAVKAFLDGGPGGWDRVLEMGEDAPPGEPPSPRENIACQSPLQIYM